MRSTGFRRTFAAIGVCSCLALTATACGSGDDDAANGKTRITVNCEPPKSAKVDRKFFDDDVAAFEKKNPDIDVVAHDAFPCQDPKTFDAKLAGGRMEDVFYTYFTDARHVVDIGQAADLTQAHRAHRRDGDRQHPDGGPVPRLPAAHHRRDQRGQHQGLTPPPRLPKGTLRGTAHPCPERP